MRYLLLLLFLWCGACSGGHHQTHSPELQAELDQRRAIVIECLEARDALSPRRTKAPEVRIEATCWFYKGSIGWIKGYTDHRNYIQVGSNRDALEHEWAAFHSGTHVHCPKDNPDCDALTNACGDRLSREWRRTHETPQCVDKRPTYRNVQGTECGASLNARPSAESAGQQPVVP